MSLYPAQLTMRGQSAPAARELERGLPIMADKKADLAGPGIGDYGELQKILP
ncbi:MAG: hypothetical protein OEQ13_03980 [Acidobacteriota bacterium]|nr:hypothetical protein [Acidobacteriota bacterium]